MRKMINENWKFVKAAENVADAVQAAGEVVDSTAYMECGRRTGWRK